MFATRSLKKENLPHTHAVARYHGCIQGSFLIGISQAKPLYSHRKKTSQKSLENQPLQIQNFLNIPHSKFLPRVLECFTPCYGDVLADHQRTGKDLGSSDTRPPLPCQGEMLPAAAVLSVIEQRLGRWRESPGQR